MGFVKEFREFSLKGNVMDLAIGVIIGAAFGKIVSSLVDNIIMPLIGLILRGKSMNEWVAKVGDAELKYGLFLSAVLDFILIALVLFLIIKTMNRMRRKTPPPAVVVTRQEELLEQIRDLLKNRS